MTDKQIIIDGVDVSGCDYFNFTDEHYCDECSSEFGCAVCDERTICYYKQLKHKEQECEELKIEVEKWESAFTLDTKMLDNADCRNNELEQQLDQLKAENDKLKQTLAEIKEITEPYQMIIK